MSGRGGGECRWKLGVVCVDVVSGGGCVEWCDWRWRW